ncbi:MAG: hypothetical protein QOC89_4920 [Paraburkholderia sp.]|nr:hypothetical protein [Paraburkholderia sp.]
MQVVGRRAFRAIDIGASAASAPGEIANSGSVTFAFIAPPRTDASPYKTFAYSPSICATPVVCAEASVILI